MCGSGALSYGEGKGGVLAMDLLGRIKRTGDRWVGGREAIERVENWKRVWTVINRS